MKKTTNTPFATLVSALISSMMVFSLPIQIYASQNGANSTNTAKPANGSSTQDTLTFYNQIPSVPWLIETMKVTAGAKDRAFLDQLAKNVPSNKLPTAKLVGSTVVIMDGTSVFKIQDLGGGRYRYANKEFSIDITKSIQENVETIESALGSKTQATTLDLFVDKAQAIGPLGAVALGVYAVGALGVYVACGWFGDSGMFKHDPVCAALAATWPLVATVGLVIWTTSSLADAAELPKSVDCGKKTADGRQSAQIVRADNIKVSLELKGNEVNSTPVPIEERKGIAKKAIGAMLQICEDPNRVSSLNQALAAYHSESAKSAPSGAPGSKQKTKN